MLVVASDDGYIDAAAVVVVDGRLARQSAIDDDGIDIEERDDGQLDVLYPLVYDDGKDVVAAEDELRKLLVLAPKRSARRDDAVVEYNDDDGLLPNKLLIVDVDGCPCWAIDDRPRSISAYAADDRTDCRLDCNNAVNSAIEGPAEI